MPLYEFKCDSCGFSSSEFRTVAERDQTVMCPKCAGTCSRDKIASMRPHTETGYQTEMLSDALGVHPDQIPEAMARFPEHRFAPDGRMRIGSHQEFKRVLKDLGMKDFRSYY